MPITLLPLSAQALYGDLFQTLLSAQASRDIGTLSGHPVSKTIKGKKYWYLQFNELGKKKQAYLGPDSREMTQFVASYNLKKTESLPDTRLQNQLCRMLSQAGGATVDALAARVLELLADSGLFRMGAVLVGSHAFICYGNMLGVSWSSATRTQDIDVAFDKTMAVVVGTEDKLDVGNILQRAQMGFHPVPAFNPKYPSTAFKIRGKELHVDMLTPSIGKLTSESPVFLAPLGLAAQPLQYLDYLIEDAEKAVVPYRNGILVNVPQPGRFFWHKLIVMQERSSFWKMKIAKDKSQCEQLAEALLTQRPNDMGVAWNDLGSKHKKWQIYAKKGLNLLASARPDLMKPIKRAL